MKNVLITGYRAHELNIFSQKHKGIAYIRQAVASKLVPLLEEGLEWVITPGQYGVDLWACEAAIGLKERYPKLKVSIVTAFAEPESGWSEEKQAYYRELLKDIDYYAAVSQGPYEGAWQFRARDELLLRKTDGMIIVYDEDAGDGSPRFMKEKAVKKAQADGYRLIGITSEDIQSIADEEASREFAEDEAETTYADDEALSQAEAEATYVEDEALSQAEAETIHAEDEALSHADTEMNCDDMVGDTDEDH